MDHSDQMIVLDRPFEEIDSALFHRLDGQRNIAVSGHDQDRERVAVRLQALQKFDAVDAGHANVGDDASKVDAGKGVEKMQGRLEQPDVEVGGTEQEIE